jgi:hypothetical protein
MLPVGRVRTSLWLLLALASSLALGQDRLVLPLKPDSLRFAVIGDTGTGDDSQYSTARQITAYRKLFPFEFVVMMGDNMYGSQKPRDYDKKFENPYRDLLALGVKFYAALGNHDDPEQTRYKLYNMNGERFYTFRPKKGVRFFALDSNYMDKPQLEWIEKELAASASEWKICFFHHPLYSSGRMHGPSLELRAQLEPLFIKHGVNVVLAGHEHFYERIKPQKGIYYFISGAGGKLRQGNVRQSDITAAAFDSDNHFMLMEIAGDELYFQTISRTGATVDRGMIPRTSKVSEAK